MGFVKETKGTKVQKKLKGASDVQIIGFSSKGDKQSKKVVSVSRKSHWERKDIAGKKMVNSKIHGEKYESLGRNRRDESGTRRKRIYPGKFSDDESIRNLVSKMGQNRAKDSLQEGISTRKGKPKYAELVNREDISEVRRKLKEYGLSDKKRLQGNARDTTEVQEVVAEGSSRGKLKKGSKSKLDMVKQLGKDQNNYASDSVLNAPRKQFLSKRSRPDDKNETDERPRKKKRIIRIDPYDDSNKRLDDGVITNDVKEKKDHSEKNDQLSNNAQFRAICPSPSILSFVEDNLLGRRREIEFKRAGYNIELSAPLDNIPFLSSTERERIEETAFRNKLEFFAAAKVASSFPPPDLPEIAFAGRSNVGKSSLLNSLTRQWGVARTSDKPGLTQSINFFKLGSKLCLVDLPGYGFAYGKKEVKESWEELVKEYISTRAGLKRVCLLIDTKWGMKARDYELIDLMERYQTKYQIVLTKTDLVFPIDVARRAMQIEEKLKGNKSAVQPAMMISSKTGAGVRSLRTALCKIARFLKP